jgi:predicted nucleic acid-binding protein
VRSLIDTNILVYADAADAPKKQRRAVEVIKAHRAAGQAVLSTQVLTEYVNVALRKLKLPPALIRERLAFYGRFEVVPASVDLVEAALNLHLLHGVALYDALIVQAAVASGCRRLLSEDLHEGAVFDGVLIVNPLKDGFGG